MKTRTLLIITLLAVILIATAPKPESYTSSPINYGEDEIRFDLDPIPLSVWTQDCWDTYPPNFGAMASEQARLDGNPGQMVYCLKKNSYNQWVQVWERECAPERTVQSYWRGVANLRISCY